MSLLDTLAFWREDDESEDTDTSPGSERIPVAELDADVPDAVPEACPECGDPVDDVYPRFAEGRVDTGETSRVCVIGSASNSPLANWRVVHR